MSPIEILDAEIERASPKHGPGRIVKLDRNVAKELRKHMTTDIDWKARAEAAEAACKTLSDSYKQLHTEYAAEQEGRIVAEARIAELEALNRKCGDLIEKQREWQVYGVKLEQDADAAMAAEIAEQRAKVKAANARIAELEAQLARVPDREAVARVIHAADYGVAALEERSLGGRLAYLKYADAVLALFKEPTP